MAGPDPQQLHRLIDRFPEPRADERFVAADGRLDGAYGRIAGDWYDELRRLADAYAEGEVLRETVLGHVEAVPDFRLTDGAAPLPDRRADLIAAAEELPEVGELSVWYHELRGLLADDPERLSPFERALHDFGYVIAHGLFLGADSPESVVKRLRLAYRLVGVRIDDTGTDGGERTTFTCPYRDLGADRYGKRWLCHEKLDRVDDGYVSYLDERGIDYQRPRGCANSAQCYSTVARESPDRWWPKTPPEAVRD
ncbi:hypothetical protein JCM30237_11940 [Halolamina litorea]|uniref:Uncharacterized protein n=1 Tax=Halolamina litorea TaxID=1515593 RepID=A0ABD6BN32_9EURY|nr:hypothetical protein [Halolamina litorea]